MLTFLEKGTDMATINGTAGNDTLTGTNGADTIYGFDGDDAIDGSLGADLMYGGAGNDTFKFSSVQSSFPAPTDVGLIDGGNGFDTIDWRVISPVTLGTIQNLRGQYVLGAYVGSQKFEITGVERIIFGNGDDTIMPASNAGGLEIRAGGGNDVVFANVGDRIFGEEGNDRIFLSGSFGGPVVTGSADGGIGVDLLQTNIAFVVDMAAGTAKSGNATFSISGFENLQMSIYNVVAEGYGNESANVMTVNSTTTAGTVGVIFDGRGGNDTITGSVYLDQLNGGSGDDHIDGGAGNDRLYGGSGDDVLIGGLGNDVIDGGTGFDRASYTSLFRTYTPAVTNGVLTIQGAAEEGTDTLTGVEAIKFKDGVFQTDPNAAFAQVLRAYDTVLGRAPDQAGLDYYVDRIEDAGWSLIGVANDIAGSQEFQAATGGLSNGAFVEYIYDHALQRAPDTGGRTFYTQALDNGMSRGAFVVDLSESAEHRDLTSRQVANGFFNTDDTYQSVALLYDGAFGRLPDSNGLAYYADRVKSGALTMTQVANDFAGSAEFRGAISGKDNGQIVDFIYQNTLDRAPDLGGRAFYKGQLDSGATAAGVLQDVALSLEHYSLFSAHIVQGIDFFG
jgi:Ca2+-binding RTX toxin-like protein